MWRLSPDGVIAPRIPADVDTPDDRQVTEDECLVVGFFPPNPAISDREAASSEECFVHTMAEVPVK